MPPPALHETSPPPTRSRPGTQRTRGSSATGAAALILVHMPDGERRLSDTAYDLGLALATLAQPLLYRRGRIPVYPDWLTDNEGNPLPALIPLDAVTARTFFDEHILFVRAKYDARSETERQEHVTLSKSEAEGLLAAHQLLQHLPEITAIHPRPLPIFNPDATLRLLPHGYDPDTGIYTYGQPPSA